MPDKLTSKEVAKHFKVCVETLYAWIRNGEIPEKYYFRLKRSWRFYPEIITDWKPSFEYTQCEKGKDEQ